LEEDPSGFRIKSEMVFNSPFPLWILLFFSLRIDYRKFQRSTPFPISNTRFFASDKGGVDKGSEKGLEKAGTVLANYKHPKLIYQDSGREMELDVFIPSLNLAFEYQVLWI
jgi:hypothetical protein